MAKFSATGRSVAALKMPVRDSEGDAIPAGNYETRSSIDRNSVVLYQNNVPLYRLDANGDIFSLQETEEEQ
jgi:hypothetical protein